MQMSQSQRAHTTRTDAARPGGTSPRDEGIASSGVTFHLWRLYQHAWLVCIFIPLVSLLREPLAPFRLVVGLVFLLGFAASYTWLMWPHPASQGAPARAHSRFSLFLFVVFSLLVLVFSLTYGPSCLWLFIGVSAMAGILLPMRSAFATIVLFTLLPALHHGGHAWRHRGCRLVVAHCAHAAGARTWSGYDRRGAHGQRYSGTADRAPRTRSPGGD